MAKGLFCIASIQEHERGLHDVTSRDMMTSLDLDVIQEDDVILEDDVIRVELKRMTSSGNVNLKVQM